MKKLILGLIIGLGIMASGSVVAYKLIEIKSYENIVDIRNFDGRSSVSVYKFEQGKDACYVATMPMGVGTSLAISCVR